MSEQGFGSPNTNDAGYGSPFQTGTSDTGYGSPFNIPSNSLYIIGETRFAPESGGEKLEVIGNYSALLNINNNLLQPIFGFKCKFVDTGSSDEYEAYSGVPGFGKLFFTDNYRSKITVYTPALPHGIYNLVLTLPDNREFEIQNVIEVINASRYEEAYSIRQSLPQYWKAGALNNQDTLPYHGFKYTNLENITGAIGEALNTTYGNTTTKLLDTFDYNDTECTVESTYNFKDKGEAIINGVSITYNGRTANQLLNVIRKNDFYKTIDVNSKVSEDNSQLRTAINDTLINKATGGILSLLSDMHGLERPQFILEDYYRKMISNVAYNAKGTYGVLLAGIESIFDQWGELQWTVNGTGTSASTIEFDSHDSIPVWENRWMRIKNINTGSSSLYYSVRREDNLFYFADVNTSMFSAANFEVASEYEIKVLPFIIEEWVDDTSSSTNPQNDINNVRRMGKVRVYVDGDIFAIAGTYLRENGEARDNEPFGMHLMNISGTNEDERFVTESQGPYPLYFSQDELSNSQNSEFGRLFDELVCSGIDLSVLNRTWVSGLSSGLSSVGNITSSGAVGTTPIYIQPE